MPSREPTTRTFPSVRLPSHGGGLPVEVTLVAQLGHGAGDQLFAATLARQQAHDTFSDALDEPSAMLGATNFEKQDATALYSFSVGPGGHPFHRHAGHRVFTAISGSDGAQLRFSTASQTQLDADPRSFLAALRHVDVPPDCLFTVRFRGGTWHQFAPRREGSSHPVLFALSCHSDELGGVLDEDTRSKVLAGRAGIAALTETLPAHLGTLLQESRTQRFEVPSVALALHAPPDAIRSGACRVIRAVAGGLRMAWGESQRVPGFIVRSGGNTTMRALPGIPRDSLLRDHLRDATVHHEDTFRLTIRGQGYGSLSAARVLGDLLHGFIVEPPTGVTWLMRLRNVLVRPLKLRTSPLGCPVSSLLSPLEGRSFDGRFPVLDQSVDGDDARAEVVLGADDRHLRFRSCVGVRIASDSEIEFTLGTRVHCLNPFGRVYLALIDGVHRRYIAPAMLRAAVAHAARVGRMPDFESLVVA